MINEFPFDLIKTRIHGRWSSGTDGHWTTRRLVLAEITDPRWIVQLTDTNPNLNQLRLLDDGDRAHWVADQMMKAPNVLGETPRWVRS